VGGEQTEFGLARFRKVGAVDTWVIWLIIAVVLGVAEIFTLTAALGLLGGAAVIASLFAAIGLPMPLQFLAFAFASVVGFVVLRPSLRGTCSHDPQDRRPILRNR